MSSSGGAAFNRSLDRVLRDKGSDERIKCTSTLVVNYNAEEDAEGREALRKWLEAYVDEFSQIRSGSIPRKTVAEFVILADINVREPADAELVRRVYTTIRQIVMGEKEDCSVYFVLALEHILSTIDKDILQEDARTLVALADRLIEMTDPQKMPLTRDTFEYHSSCLNAFERVLMVLHDLEEDRSDGHIVKYFEDKTKRRLDMIISCQFYYPFAYQALLMKEHLNALLKRDIKSNLINVGRRALHAFCGGLHIFQGVRELAVMKLDFNVMVSGLEKFQQAFKDIGRDILPSIQEIVLAASETVELDDFGIFQQCFDKHKKVSWLEGLKWSKQRAIRYALVSHLCLFCTEKHSISVQAPALDLVVKLVNEDEGKQWRDDKDIFEAMIDALIGIGKHNQEYNEKVINAFNTISSSQIKQHKKIIYECLNGMSFEERIKCGYKDEVDDTTRSLFHSTRQRLGLHVTAPIYNQNQLTLKAYYKDDSFAKVSLLADKINGQHIKGFDFNLVEYEKIVVIQDTTNQSSRDNYNQRENNMQRSMIARKPLNMQDLFKKRQKTLHGFLEDVKSVLVIGDPGTGKTCLSKRLSYDWAINAWGSEFTHVYCLPIRRLSDKNFGNDVDLSFVIQQVLYKSRGTHESYKALYKEINDNLSEPTTLLILDGYDEAGELAKDLVLSALTRGCRSLVLSRPHGVQDILSRIDMEVECLELSDYQLERFVRKQLEQADATALLEFLSGNVSIKDACRVAVNAQIVTRLWRNAPSRRQLRESDSANLKHLYSMIANYIWRRFVEKSKGNFNRDMTYDRLERIAFESLKQGLVEIPEQLVMEHAPEIEGVFRDSGFLLFVEEGIVFQFAHLTFHEYFAGCHLAKMLKSTNEDERKKAEKFISEHKYVETSRVMLAFMTQCYCTKGDIEENLGAFKNLMQVFDKDQVSIVGFSHLFLKMRILDAFLPCGLKEPNATHDNVVKQVVESGRDVLKGWIGIERNSDIHKASYVEPMLDRSPIIDELERMPNLFHHFLDLLKTVVVDKFVESRWQDDSLHKIAKIGRLNPKYALECIKPILNKTRIEERIRWIKLCAYIGPTCAKHALKRLKELYEDKNPTTRRHATNAIGAFLDLCPNRKDVRKLISRMAKDECWEVRASLVRVIGFSNFTRGSRARSFAWKLMVKAIEMDSHKRVKRRALELCCRHCPTSDESANKLANLVSKFLESSDQDDREAATFAVRELIQSCPEKSKKAFASMIQLCKDSENNGWRLVVEGILRVIESSCSKTEELFSMLLALFEVGAPEVQLQLLPILFSFETSERNCAQKVNELIDARKDLDEDVRKKVREKAKICMKARTLMSNYTVEEIWSKFEDQSKEEQFEIVRQLDLSKRTSDSKSGAIAKMALSCLHKDVFFARSWGLLGKLANTELLPSIVLEELAKRGGKSMVFGLGSLIYHNAVMLIRKQPLYHLLDYYWDKKDKNVIPFIAEKLLFSAVISESNGKKEMVISVREKGTLFKQTAPAKVVRDLLEYSKLYLNAVYKHTFPRSQESSYKQRC